MILPLICPVLCSELGVIVLSVRQVIHSMMAGVSLLQIFRNICQRVSVQGFEACRWIGHRDDPVRDVSQVQVEVIVAKTVALPRDLFAEPIHYSCLIYIE